MTVTAVLLAAGRGKRMRGEKNKVFLTIRGTTLLTRAAASLCSTPRVQELIVVAHPTELAEAAACLPPLGIPVRVVAGGEQRQDSSLAGVAVAAGEYVLVHDAARPFPSRELVERVIHGAHQEGACIPVVAVVDTLRRVGDDGLASRDVVDRTGLFCVQTPQGFRTKLLLKALERGRTGEPQADDAAAVLAMGLPVHTVPGDSWNIKITTSDDLNAAALLAAVLETP